jgi:hypothetical protein
MNTQNEMNLFKAFSPHFFVLTRAGHFSEAPRRIAGGALYAGLN